MVGKGSFGNVHLATTRTKFGTTRTVAVKVCEDMEWDSAQNEMRACIQLHSLACCMQVRQRRSRSQIVPACRPLSATEALHLLRSHLCRS